MRLVQEGELVDAVRVPAAVERRGEEDLQRALRDELGREALAEAGDVGVVVPPRHLGLERVVDDGATGTGDLVHRHADALAAAAARDAELGLPAGHRTPDPRAEARVVRAFGGVRADVDDVVALGDEPVAQ